MRTLAALLVALLLAGCGSTATGGEATEAGDDPASAAAGGSADLDFEATTLAGETFDGESLAGRPAVLWFWAPWCPTCRGQIPNLTDLAQRYGDEVSFVGVGGLSDESSIEELAGDIDHVTHLIDTEGTVWSHFGVTEQSTFTVLDADGAIVSEGYLTDARLNDLVGTLVPE